MKYLFKTLLRILFLIMLMIYLFTGLAIIIPAIIYIFNLNEDPIGCTIDFIDHMYWKINNSYI